MIVNNQTVVYCITLEEWQFLNSKLNSIYRTPDHKFIVYKWRYKNLQGSGGLEGDIDFYKRNEYTIYTFDEWLINRNLNIKNKIGMKDTILDALNKTYNNEILRKTTIPTFFSNPGTGKSSIIRQFAKDKKVNLVKITLSQRMPSEVVGIMMPDKDTQKLIAYDSHELSSLKDGDILFFDEVFNGTLKQTLDAVLNLLEDRMLPSGKQLADVMIVAASNPQGLINLSPQIKERFIRYNLKFSREEFQDYLQQKYGMPKFISNNLCILISKEKFEHDSWNYNTPRSLEKAINQIGCDLISPYNEILLPFLNEQISSPVDLSCIGINKGDKIEYIKLLKLILQNDTKDNKFKDRTTTDLVS